MIYYLLAIVFIFHNAYINAGDVKCPTDLLTCPDGKTKVARDPANQCKFKDCFTPDTSGSSSFVCPTDVQLCPDGHTYVKRDTKKNCNFEDCPKAGSSSGSGTPAPAKPAPPKDKKVKKASVDKPSPSTSSSSSSSQSSAPSDTAKNSTSKSDEAKGKKILFIKTNKDPPPSIGNASINAFLPWLETNNMKDLQLNSTTTLMGYEEGSDPSKPRNTYYRVEMLVKCILDGGSDYSSKFRLDFVVTPKQYVYLEECNQIFGDQFENWLAVINDVAVCENPVQQGIGNVRSSNGATTYMLSPGNPIDLFNTLYKNLDRMTLVIASTAAALIIIIVLFIGLRLNHSFDENTNDTDVMTASHNEEDESNAGNDEKADEAANNELDDLESNMPKEQEKAQTETTEATVDDDEEFKDTKGEVKEHVEEGTFL